MELQERVIDIRQVAEQHMAAIKARDQARDLYGPKIQHGEASQEEIVEWYFASDPVESSYYFELDTAKATSDIDAVYQLLEADVQEAILLGIGGLSLLVSLLQIEEKITDDMLHKDKVSTVLEEFRYGRHVAPKDLPYLFIAAEMLRKSTVNIRQGIAYGNFQYVDKRALDEGGVPVSKKPHSCGIAFDGTEAEFNEMLTHQNVISDSVLNYLGLHATVPEHEDIDDAIRMLGLQARVLYASSWMSDHFDGLNGERFLRAKQEFKLLVSDLKKVFGGDLTISKRLKDPEVKGALHEIMWFMDAYVLRMMWPEEYSQIRANPVYSRDDAPRIGYPRQKRGIDMRVSTQKAMDLLQLKSSAKKRQVNEPVRSVLPPDMIGHLNEYEQECHFAGDDPYNPEIIVLYEPNFREVDRRRLMAKLVAYERLAENGFSDSMRPDAKKYVMESVWWEYETISKKHKDRTKQLRALLMSNFIMPVLTGHTAREGGNRAQRRRDERAARSRRR